jgi:hypothetical protein
MPASAVALRAMAPKPQVAPVGAHAPAEAFAPNSGDKAQAKKTGEPVRVSVWDQALTSTRSACGRSPSSPASSPYPAPADPPS